VGPADKAGDHMMVGILLPGVEPAGPDAADALAVAICHAHLVRTGASIAARLSASFGGAVRQ
ncbi:MAG: hypothetical protein AB7E69_21390, partial [Sphingomonadales bacterium]